jgi:hypothetical protein
MRELGVRAAEPPTKILQHREVRPASLAVQAVAVRAADLNWLESRHPLAPAHETESGKSTSQQRERRRLRDRIGAVADIIHTDDIITNIYCYAGDRPVSVGEPNKGGSTAETGVGNVDRFACAVTEGNCFAAVLHTAKIGAERIRTPAKGKCSGSTEQQQKLRSSRGRVVTTRRINARWHIRCCIYNTLSVIVDIGSGQGNAGC